MAQNKESSAQKQRKQKRQTGVFILRDSFIFIYFKQHQLNVHRQQGRIGWIGIFEHEIDLFPRQHNRKSKRRFFGEQRYFFDKQAGV